MCIPVKRQILTLPEAEIPQKEKRMKYHIEGWFEGDIEADSREEAMANFGEFDIESMDVRVAYEIEEDE